MISEKIIYSMKKNFRIINIIYFFSANCIFLNEVRISIFNYIKIVRLFLILYFIILEFFFYI